MHSDSLTVASSDLKSCRVNSTHFDSSRLISVKAATPASGWRAPAGCRRARRGAAQRIATPVRRPPVRPPGRAGPVCRRWRSARHRPGCGWPPRLPATAGRPRWQPPPLPLVARPQHCRRPVRAPAPADWWVRHPQPPSTQQWRTNQHLATSGPSKPHWHRPALPAKMQQCGATRGFGDWFALGDYHGTQLAGEPDGYLFGHSDTSHHHGVAMVSATTTATHLRERQR